MARFMIVTFAFLGWAFYELSGGAEFEPAEVAKSPLNELQEVVARAANAPATAPVAVVSTQSAQIELASAAVETTPQASLAVVLGEAAQQVEPEVTEVAAAPVADIRFVNGNRVNVRNGPGTNYSVVAQLNRDAEAVVLQSDGNGWVKIRVADTGGIGWMAERLLRAAN